MIKYDICVIFSSAICLITDITIYKCTSTIYYISHHSENYAWYYQRGKFLVIYFRGCGNSTSPRLLVTGSVHDVSAHVVTVLPMLQTCRAPFLTHSSTLGIGEKNARAFTVYIMSDVRVLRSHSRQTLRPSYLLPVPRLCGAVNSCRREAMHTCRATKTSVIRHTSIRVGHSCVVLSCATLGTQLN